MLNSYVAVAGDAKDAEDVSVMRSWLLVTEQLVFAPEKAVCSAWLSSKIKMIEKSGEFTYDIISLNFLIVHGMELRLTLVELVQVSHLESDPCMCLVDLDGERVRYPLDCQVLPHRSELLVDVAIVGQPLLPLFVHELKSLL